MARTQLNPAVTATPRPLRAPPIMLLGKYAAKPSLPLLSAIVIVGYGVASALAPYLALTLREIGEVLDLAEGTVRGRLKRGLERLRAQVVAQLSLPRDEARVTFEDLESWAVQVRRQRGKS